MDLNPLRSGYLIKLDSIIQRTWKKRFFVVSDTCIVYFEDHHNVQKAKGKVLLFNDSTVVTKEDTSSYKNCFSVCTTFAELHLSASSPEEKLAWMDIINQAIGALKALPRGYLTKRGGLLEGGNKRKYFVLHPDCINYHADSDHLTVIQGSIKIRNTKFSFMESISLITVQYKKEL